MKNENELIIKESKLKYIILFGVIVLGVGFYFYNKININFGELYSKIVSWLPQNTITFVVLLLVVGVGWVIFKGFGLK